MLLKKLKECHIMTTHPRKSYILKYRGEFLNKIIPLILISLVIKLFIIYIKPQSLASIDLIRFDKVIAELKINNNPYVTTNYLNYPPFWLQFLFTFEKISSYIHVSTQSIILIFLSLIESLLLVVYAYIFKELNLIKKFDKFIFFGFIINPISISQICIQGHFDVFLNLFVSLSILFTIKWIKSQNKNNWILSCIMLGQGILLKTVPLICTPLIFVKIKNISKFDRILGILLLIYPAFLGLSIIYSLNPDAITKHVLGYRSIEGYFGITGLLAYYNYNSLMRLYNILSMLFIIYFFVSTIIKLSQIEELSLKSVIEISLLILLFPIVFGGGFGLQYIYWIYPQLLTLYFIYSDSKNVLSKIIFITLVISSIDYALEYSLFQGGVNLFLRLKLNDNYITHILEAISDYMKTGRNIVIFRLPMYLCLLFTWLFVYSFNKKNP